MARRSGSSNSSSSTKGYRRLHGAGKENHTTTRSPGYMTPTFASKQSKDRATTPMSMTNNSVKQSTKGRQFLVRVGLKRGPQTPPRRLSPDKICSLNDKVGVTSSGIQDPADNASSRQRSMSAHLLLLPRPRSPRRCLRKTNLYLLLLLPTSTPPAHQRCLAPCSMRPTNLFAASHQMASRTGQS